MVQQESRPRHRKGVSISIVKTGPDTSARPATGRCRTLEIGGFESAHRGAGHQPSANQYLPPELYFAIGLLIAGATVDTSPG
jgi:hypothetical protein